MAEANRASHADDDEPVTASPTSPQRSSLARAGGRSSSNAAHGRSKKLVHRYAILRRSPGAVHD